MKKHRMHLMDLSLNKDWTLFLDRDGVVNKRLIADYVKTPEEFVFIKGVPEALAALSGIFGRIFIVTNQQGIGKGLMTEEDLRIIHDRMVRSIERKGGFISKIYHCPELKKHNSPFRKPNTGMAEQAKLDFPEIDFSMSIMVGDSQADMEFGRRMGMKNVYVGELKNPAPHIDLVIRSLPELVAHLLD